jgi:hypothetical protein
MWETSCAQVVGGGGGAEPAPRGEGAGDCCRAAERRRPPQAAKPPSGWRSAPGGRCSAAGPAPCSSAAQELVGHSWLPQCGLAAAPTETACDEPAADAAGSAGMLRRGMGAGGYCVGKSKLRRRTRGAGAYWRWGATGRFALLALCSMAALAPREVSGQIRYFNPVYIFGGQELFLCNDPHRPRRNPHPNPNFAAAPIEWNPDAEEWSPGAIPVECSNPNIEPELVTLGEGRRKACTHDLTVRYECNSLETVPGCVCFGSCLPINSQPAECLDVVYALEDTWTYLGIHIEHGPGTPGVSRPFEYDDSDPSFDPSIFHLLFRLTVRFGELDLLNTLHSCEWRKPEKDPRDTQFDMIKYTCDVATLPGEWNTPTKKPYHIRYILFQPQNQVNTMMSLEFSGTYAIVDPLIRLVRYKSRPNENSDRIKSPIYNKLSSKVVPNELMQLDVFNTIQTNGRPSIDRCG